MSSMAFRKLAVLFTALVVPVGVAAQSLSLSSYFGGSNIDAGLAVAVDSAGNAYLTGSVSSALIPCRGALTSTQNAFVLKINANGSVGWCEYMGGTGVDTANAIAIDASGSIFIAGSTSSPGLASGGAFQSQLSGPQDAFIAKLNPAGSLQWRTYLGGPGSDQANSIALDSVGNIYVTGFSTSSGYPVKGPLIPGPRYGGGAHDAVVTKLNAGGGSLDWSTYLGGAADDVGYMAALAPDGTLYVTGYTASSNFPVTAGSLQTELRASRTAWVTHLGTDGSLLQSTFLGGSSSASEPCTACAAALAIDQTGNPWVAGLTGEADFPITADTAMQPTFGGGMHDAFIVELTPDLSSETYGTFAGGSSDDGCVALGFDSMGDLWCHGNTFSRDFPVTSDAYQPTSGGPPDAFLLGLSPSGSLLYSTYLGGSGLEYGGATQSLAVGASGIWLTGWTASTDFPLVAPFDSALGGEQDAFLAWFALL